MSLRVEVPEVTVDVGVLLEKTHQFVPGLKPSNFRFMKMEWSRKLRDSNARRRRLQF